LEFFKKKLVLGFVNGRPSEVLLRGCRGQGVQVQRCDGEHVGGRICGGKRAVQSSDARLRLDFGQDTATRAFLFGRQLAQIHGMNSVPLIMSLGGEG